MEEMEEMTTIEKIWFKRGVAIGLANVEARRRAEAEAQAESPNWAKMLEAAFEAALRVKFGETACTAMMPRVRLLTFDQQAKLVPLIDSAPSADAFLQQLHDAG